MVLTVFGISHRTATLTEREPFQIARRELGEAVLQYRRIAGVDETVILATCNRIEFYRAHSQKGDHGREVVAFYRGRGVERPGRILDFAYRHVGAGAARHLFRVASGMDSLILGEEQVRGQLKDAYSSACAFGGPGKVLHKLFHHAFRVSKQIKTETALGGGIRSIPGAAAELLLADPPDDPRALVIGADETAAVVLEALARRSIPSVVGNRTLYAAEKLAEDYGAKAVSLERLRKPISEVNLIFSATGSKETVLTPELVGSRDSHSLVIADLAIPRDVDPAVGEIEGVKLIDLQDLKHHLLRTEQQRSDELPRAQDLIERQVDGFLEWLHSRSFTGGVEAVKQEMHQAASEELNRFLPGFHKSESKALEAFSHSLLKRFLKIARRHFDPDGASHNGQVLRMDPAAIDELEFGNGDAADGERDGDESGRCKRGGSA